MCVCTDFNPPISPADVVYAVSALLTCPPAYGDSDVGGSRGPAGGSSGALPGGGAGAGAGAGAGSGAGAASAGEPAESGLTMESRTWRICFEQAYNALERWVTRCGSPLPPPPSPPRARTPCVCTHGLLLAFPGLDCLLGPMFILAGCTGRSLNCCLKASSTPCTFRFGGTRLPSVLPLLPSPSSGHAAARTATIGGCFPAARSLCVLARALQKAIVRLAPTLFARKGLWSTGYMRVLKIDEFTEVDQRLFTQPLALARLGRYLISMRKVQSDHTEHAHTHPTGAAHPRTVVYCGARVGTPFLV
jgi:hypothetical protein